MTNPESISTTRNDRVEQRVWEVAEATANRIHRVEDLILDENIPEADFSRPTRGFFNITILAAYLLGKRHGKAIQKRRQS